MQTAGRREPGTGARQTAAGPAGTEALAATLGRLDVLLTHAAARMRERRPAASPADAFRGLFVDHDDAARLLERQPLEPSLLAGAPARLVDAGSAPFARLAEMYELDGFELDTIAVALAPELDLRYERLYGYLQDDVTRKRPTIDLVLDLICPSPSEKLARRTAFACEAALVRNLLVRIVADPAHVDPPLLAHFVKLDEQVVNLLLGQDATHPRLAAFSRIIVPGDDSNGARDLPLARLIGDARRVGRSLVVHLRGPYGSGRRATAEHVAARCGARLLVVDVVAALAQERPFEELVLLALREARLRDALPYLDGVDALLGEERARELETLASALESAGVALLAGERTWSDRARGPVVLVVPFQAATFAQARGGWRRSAEAVDASVEETDLDALAGRFRLTPRQIERAALAARDVTSLRAAGERPTAADLFEGARRESGHGLAALARKIEPLYSWDDIVLPDDALAQLRELCGRVVLRHRVLEEWGFERRLSLGTAASALFSGPSGTGKTMAAEIIAREVGLDLFKINLSAVVSKYIGETEKNLDRIFRTAESANAILLFDEAEALFGKRSEVRDSHDRYANIEIAYLLQKMEEYEGVAILATNLRQNVDESFLRRLAFTIHFPFPDETERRRIWARIWPPETPRADDVDLDLLAREFRLAGGNIKNVALAAAYVAAEDGGCVTMQHVLHATRREYQKLGKAIVLEDVGARDGA